MQAFRSFDRHYRVASFRCGLVVVDHHHIIGAECFLFFLVNHPWLEQLLAMSVGTKAERTPKVSPVAMRSVV